MSAALQDARFDPLRYGFDKTVPVGAPIARGIGHDIGGPGQAAGIAGVSQDLGHKHPSPPLCRGDPGSGFHRADRR
jgi:hypothetical protein